LPYIDLSWFIAYSLAEFGKLSGIPPRTHTEDKPITNSDEMKTCAMFVFDMIHLTEQIIVEQSR
jgi:hypothetical protein